VVYDISGKAEFAGTTGSLRPSGTGED